VFEPLLREKGLWTFYEEHTSGTILTSSSVIILIEFKMNGSLPRLGLLKRTDDCWNKVSRGQHSDEFQSNMSNAAFHAHYYRWHLS
jgi:hypothetical protein